MLLGSWFKGGKFNTSMAYDWMRIKHSKKPWTTAVWKRYIPPKMSFILWLAMRGRLNTKNLWLTDTEDLNCVFCSDFPESVSHLFFNCNFVGSIWREIRLWLNIQRSMSTLYSVVKWIKKDYGDALFKSKAVRLAFAATVYITWLSRNKILFAGKHVSSSEIVYNIKLLVHSVLQSLYPCDGISFLF